MASVDNANKAMALTAMTITQCSADAIANSGVGSPGMPVKGADVVAQGVRVSIPLVAGDMCNAIVTTTSIGAMVVGKQGFAVFSGKAVPDDKTQFVMDVPHLQQWSPNALPPIDEVYTAYSLDGFFMCVRCANPQRSFLVFVHGELVLTVYNGLQYEFHAFADGCVLFQRMHNNLPIAGFEAHSIMTQSATSSFYGMFLTLPNSCFGSFDAAETSDVNSSSSSEDSAVIETERDWLDRERQRTVVFRKRGAAVWWMATAAMMVVSRDPIEDCRHMLTCPQQPKTERVLAIFDNSWSEDKNSVLAVCIVDGHLVLVQFSLHCDSSKTATIVREKRPLPLYCQSVTYDKFPLVGPTALKTATTDRCLVFFDETSRQAGILCMINDVYVLNVTTYPAMPTPNFEVGSVAADNDGFVVSLWACNGSWFGSAKWDIVRTQNNRDKDAMQRAKLTVCSNTSSRFEQGPCAWFDANMPPWTHDTTHVMIGAQKVADVDTLLREMNISHVTLQGSLTKATKDKAMADAKFDIASKSMHTLKAQLTASEKRVKELESQVDTLSSRLADSVTRAGTINENAFKAGVDASEETLQRMIASCSKAEAETKKLRAALEQAKRESTNARAKADKAVKAAEDKADKAVKAAEDRVAKALSEAEATHRAEMERIRADAVTALANVVERQGAHDECMRNLASAQQDIERLQQQLDSLRSQTKTATTAAKQHMEKALATQAQALETKHAQELATRAQTLEAKHAQELAQELAAQAQKHAQELTQELATQAQTLGAKRAQELAKELAAQAQALGAKHAQEDAAHKKTLAAKDKELKAALEAQQKFNAELKAMQIMCNAAGAAQADAEKKLQLAEQELQAQPAQMQQKLRDLEQHKVALEARVKQLQDAPAALAAPAAPSSSIAAAMIADTLKSTNDALLQQLNVLQEQLRFTQEQQRPLLKQLEDSKADTRSAYAQIQALKTEVERLQTEAKHASENAAYFEQFARGLQEQMDRQQYFLQQQQQQQQRPTFPPHRKQ